MTEKKRSNIVLIGMPGSGKSTVGVVLAKLVAKDFVDSDILIQQREKKALQEILDAHGHLHLREIEEEVILAMRHENHVIATGGSVPYSSAAMEHLQKKGVVVYLYADMETLYRRVDNYESRGIAKRPEQSMEDIFDERCALYEKYAEITVDCRMLGHDETAEKIVSELEKME